MTRPNTSDAQIDRLVKAGWLAIGLSQRDLADVLDAALSPPAGDKRARRDARRLMEVAEALADDLYGAGARENEPTEAGGVPAQLSGSLPSLLDLRLLRAFCRLDDRRTKLVLVHLAEQFAKRQANRAGNAS
jgi:hypothetical protein